MQQRNSLRILIADDHALVRVGLVSALQGRQHIAIVAEASSGEAAVELYRKHRPDVALLDVRMPGIGGLEALRRVRAEHAEACVVMLSTAEFDEEVQQAVEAGAMGYIGKTSTTAALVAALKGAARGERQFSPGLLRSLKAATRLAPRELEVLTGMARGWSNKEIAARLHLSTHTVKTYVKGVLEKLGVPDRAGAVSEGFRRGILKV